MRLAFANLVWGGSISLWKRNMTRIWSSWLSGSNTLYKLFNFSFHLRVKPSIRGAICVQHLLVSRELRPDTWHFKQKTFSLNSTGGSEEYFNSKIWSKSYIVMIRAVACFFESHHIQESPGPWNWHCRSECKITLYLQTIG